MDALTEATVEAYVLVKHLPVTPERLATWGVTNEPCPYSGRPSIGIRYFYPDGQLARIKHRYTNGTSWGWWGAEHLIPYGLWWLERIHRERPVILVEGESDCHTAWGCGHLAIGIPGNVTWRPEWARWFEGRTVFVLYEPVVPGKKGDPGRRMCERVAASLPDARVIRPTMGKDLNDLHCLAGDFDGALRELLDAAEPIRDVVIPAPDLPPVRILRGPAAHESASRHNLDVAKAHEVPLYAVLQGLGFDVQRRGREYVATCPFHDDGKPSLCVYHKGGRWQWYCFPCDCGGDAMDFMQRLRGLSFHDAVRAVMGAA